MASDPLGDVALIGQAATGPGLTVWAEWDPGTYPTGIPLTPAGPRLNLSRMPCGAGGTIPSIPNLSVTDH